MQAPTLADHKMLCDKGDMSSLYQVNQVKGQIIATYIGVDELPPRGTEIFFKKIPRDALLQEVFNFIQQCGTVYQIRLLMDFSGYNRGFGFATFFESSSAHKAVCSINGAFIRPGQAVVVKVSLDNNRIHARGIPQGLSAMEVFHGFSNVIGNGLKCVTLKRSELPHCQDCILQYMNHRFALEARKHVWPKIVLWGKQISFDWAVPLSIQNTKRIYFKNVPAETAKVYLYEELAKRLDVLSMINLFKRGKYGYIVFLDGKQCQEAMQKLKDFKIGNNVIEFSTSKFSVPDSELTADFHDEIKNEENAMNPSQQLSKHLRMARIYFKCLNGVVTKRDIVENIQSKVNVNDIVSVYLRGGTCGFLLYESKDAAAEAYTVLKDAVTLPFNMKLQFSMKKFHDNNREVHVYTQNGTNNNGLQQKQGSVRRGPRLEITSAAVTTFTPYQTTNQLPDIQDIQFNMPAPILPHPQWPLSRIPELPIEIFPWRGPSVSAMMPPHPPPGGIYNVPLYMNNVFYQN